MKSRLLFIGILFSIIMASCKKSSQEVTAAATDLQGKWELRVISGYRGIAYPEGSGNVLEFNKNIYTKFEDGDIVQSGTFYVVKDTSVKQAVGLLLKKGEYESRIGFNDNTDPKVFYQISKDTLCTLQGFFPADGGYKSIYVRVN